MVLTGVIQETDVDTTYKYPLLGDIPLLGGLFKSKQKSNEKRELIILVTPKVLEENSNTLSTYDLEFSSDDSKILLKK